MKKISIFALAALMSLSMLSCDIESYRTLTATVTIVLEDIPGNVKAVSIWCAANEWKADNVNGNPLYISEVENGKAKFVLEDYVQSEPLQFQLTPMPSFDTKMGDDWWSYAISGSSEYSKNKNNITCDFVAKAKTGDQTLVINKLYYGEDFWKNKPFPVYGVSATRWFNEAYTGCFGFK